MPERQFYQLGSVRLLVNLPDKCFVLLVDLFFVDFGFQMVFSVVLLFVNFVFLIFFLIVLNRVKLVLLVSSFGRTVA